MSALPIWQPRDHTLTPGDPPLILGIVNVTPDSFSDGGRFFDTEAAVAHALRMVEQGADILDIGGESTRPGSQAVALDVELSRVLPVIRRLAGQTSALLSVDTSKSEVARQALEAGAHVLNDVTALRGDPEMFEVARSFDAGVILMHAQGTPATMQVAPHYDDVVAEVSAFLQTRLQACVERGIAASRIVLDPGIGFGKTTWHSLRLIACLEELQRLGRPVCLGVSRKGFLGKTLGRPLEQRLAGSLTAACYALTRRTAQLLRVHDVSETHDAVQLIQELHRVSGTITEGCRETPRDAKENP